MCRGLAEFDFSFRLGDAFIMLIILVFIDFLHELQRFVDLGIMVLLLWHSRDGCF